MLISNKIHYFRNFMLQMYVLHMYYAIHATMNYYYLTEYLHKKSNYV